MDRMRFIPHTERDVQEMLEEIGISSVEDLFKDIPIHVRQKARLKLPLPLSEAELTEHLNRLADLTGSAKDYLCFLGGGAYNHFIPSAVWHIISRSEFYSSYTPYQPELSQGTLQTIFEYQTLICQLTGMDVANASMYDGASSLAEGILMANRINKRGKALLSKAIHPEYRHVVSTYIRGLDLMAIEVPYDTQGVTDLEKLETLLDERTCCVAVQYPNFFGCIEDIDAICSMAHEKGALFIAVICEPISLGILKPPGEFGSDIAVGEGQSLGIPLYFGGPYLGIFAAKEKYVRNMPGRLVGETVDQDGQRGFVLTLATREQHIRRERATSNICTNHSLCALASAAFMTLMGKRGLRELAHLNLSISHYAMQEISSIPGLSLKFSAPFFNEFVVELKNGNAQDILGKLLKKKILGGIAVERFYPELEGCILMNFTECHTKEDVDRLCKELATISLQT